MDPALGGALMTHTFTLVLDTDPERSVDLLANSLFDAGCSDALLGIADGVVRLDFDREAGSLVEAIASAIEQVESTEACVVHVAGLDPTDQPAVQIRILAAFNGALVCRLIRRSCMDDPALAEAVLRLVTR